MNRRRLLLTIAVAGVLAACGQSPDKFKGIDLTGADFGRDFRLQDPSGKWRTLADFRGQYVMIFFGFVQCPSVCPTALVRAVEVRKALGPDSGRVQVLFITVDPERDTPQLLRDYTQVFDASIIGLRGDTQLTRATAKEFRVYYEREPLGDSYTMSHTALTYIFDAQGRLRLAMPHDLKTEDYIADLRALMAQAAQPAKGKS